MKPSENETCLVSGIGAAIFAAFVVYALTGCAGEIYIGTRQIDTVTQTQEMTEKSWLERVGFKSAPVYQATQK